MHLPPSPPTPSHYPAGAAAHQAEWPSKRFDRSGVTPTTALHLPAECSRVISWWGVSCAHLRPSAAGQARDEPTTSGHLGARRWLSACPASHLHRSSSPVPPDSLRLSHIPTCHLLLTSQRLPHRVQVANSTHEQESAAPKAWQAQPPPAAAAACCCAAGFLGVNSGIVARPHAIHLQSGPRHKATCGCCSKGTGGCTGWLGHQSRA
jgi:hypothetical protein